MSTVTPPTATLRSAAECAAALPDLIGFTPEESLVIIYMSSGRVIVTMRLDLDQLDASINDYAVMTAHRVGADGAVIVVAASADSPHLPCTSLLVGLERALTEASVDVLDALRITNGRFWSALCRDPQCCPTEGTPVPEASTERMSGAAEGPIPRREQLCGKYLPSLTDGPSLDSCPGEEQLPVPPVGARAEAAWDALNVLAGDPALQVPGSEGDQLRADLLLAIQHVTVRDYVLAKVAAEPDVSGPRVDVVVSTALRAPVPLRPRAAGMAAALLAAFEMSSVPASCLVDLADGDSLAELVRASITSAVSPLQLREVFAEALPLVLQQLEASDSAA